MEGWGPSPQPLASWPIAPETTSKEKKKKDYNNLEIKASTVLSNVHSNFQLIWDLK